MSNVDSLRPKSVTVICALWLVWGLGNAANGLLDAIRAHHTKAAFEQMVVSELQRPLPAELDGQFNTVMALALSIFVVSLSGAIGAAFLMRLRGWARTLLELANWGTVLIVAAFALHAMSMRLEAAARLSMYSSVHGDTFGSVLLMGFMYMLGAIPFVYIAFKLRSRATHEAIYRVHMREVTAESAS